ncbi:hypothetical protein [Maricaulis sp.]|uniref:hypothetical protein n=1 Tax=Maricaulis sp. TaxID=1486257 RepID=UPI002B264DFC|nr:hypothetical protein [Maricaulis sp.]
MTRTPATRSCWEAVPFNAEIEIPYSATFSVEEFGVIKRGLVPQSMDHKWFIFYEDNALYLHRSWNGHGMFKVEFQVREAGVSIATARTVDDYATDTTYAAQILGFLIEGFLLGRSVSFPTPPAR